MFCLLGKQPQKLGNTDKMSKYECCCHAMFTDRGKQMMQLLKAGALCWTTLVQPT